MKTTGVLWMLVLFFGVSSGYGDYTVLTRVDQKYGLQDTFQVSPDGKSVAYVLRTGNQYTISLNGHTQNEYDWIHIEPTMFSPDGARYMYFAIDQNKRLVVLDGQEIPHTYNGLRSHLFSPDGKRYIYAGQQENKWAVIVDGKATPYHYDNILVGTTVFSPDSQRYMYAAQRQKTWSVSVDGTHAAQQYDGIGRGTLSFSPDSQRYIYAVQLQNRWSVVVDGTADPRTYDEIGDDTPIFSPDSNRYLYTARQQQQWSVIIDGEPLANKYEKVAQGTPVFSPDSQRHLYAAQQQGKWSIVIDGEGLSRQYDGVLAGSLKFSPDSSRYMYAARNQQTWTVAVDGREPLQRYSAVLNDSMLFSPDSQRYLYAARRHNHSWVAVIDGRENLRTYDAILEGSLVFSPDSQRYLYAAQRQNKWYLVVDGSETGPFDQVLEARFSPDSAVSVAMVVSGNKIAFVYDGTVMAHYDEYHPGTLHLCGNSKGLSYVVNREGTWYHYSSLPSTVAQPVVKGATPIAGTQPFSAILGPSHDAQTVDSPHGVKITIPGNTLQHEETITIASVTDAPAPPPFAQRLNTFKITVGDQVYFKEPLWIEVAYDQERLPTDLAPIHALKVSYWDTLLEMWVESPVWVDETNHRLLFPTHHLTDWAIDVVGSDGHIYNDFFSMHYSLEELKTFEARYGDHAFAGSSYVQAVFNTLNDARKIYEQAGFRELEKIRAVTRTSQHISGYAAAHGVLPQTLENRRYNVYLTGSSLDSDASRGKYTGAITIPIDPFDGVNRFQIAHELFHNIQSRYYTMIGMTELGVPLTTAPSTTLLARQWWLEGTADYAAGRIAYPVNGQPNPLMGGTIEPRFLEKPLTHSPSALAFWRRADHHSYNCAWFFEYLVTHKGLPFREMFETVASYHNPSVYSNLSRYIASKNLHINDVYTEFVLWWFTGGDSPLGPEQINRAISSTTETKSNPRTRLSFEFSDVLDELRVQRTADYRHTAQITRITADPGYGGAPKPLIFVIPKELSTHRLSRIHAENSLFLFDIPDKAAAPSEIRAITAEHDYQVHTVSDNQQLFAVAVNNKGSAWYPKLDVYQVSFTTSRQEVEGGIETEVRAENIPDVLAKPFVFKWYADGKEIFSDPAPDVEKKDNLMTVISRHAMPSLDEQVITTVRLFSAEGELLGEGLVDHSEMIKKQQGLLSFSILFDEEEIRSMRVNHQVFFTVPILEFPVALQVDIDPDGNVSAVMEPMNYQHIMDMRASASGRIQNDRLTLKGTWQTDSYRQHPTAKVHNEGTFTIDVTLEESERFKGQFNVTDHGSSATATTHWSHSDSRGEESGVITYPSTTLSFAYIPFRTDR
ncbi:TolB family protein [Desulfobulbus alkaliphilus]|uniref:TolB family protein n=1 Tax=Desulfobulbus alkaliphilus TaxID=869814 RepID=UPI0019629A8A|nr:hypothetical protein [Desulfobulbus alkaliphilus]